MTGPEHYQEAETQAESAARAIDDRLFEDARVSLGLAQVHATLALAAATGGARRARRSGGNGSGRR